MFQAYLKASWEFPEIVAAQNAWRPEMLPLINGPALKAKPSSKSVPPPLTDAEGIARIPEIIRRVQNMLARECAPLPVEALLPLWKELQEDIPNYLTNQLYKNSEDMRALLGCLKDAKLAWLTSKEPVRLLWEYVEKTYEKQLPMLLRLALELALRDATITEFLEAGQTSEAKDFRSILHYLDYRRGVKKGEKP